MGKEVYVILIAYGSEVYERPSLEGTSLPLP